VEADSIEQLRKKMEAAGESVLEYFNINRMVTNPGKTAMLVFRPTSSNNIADRVRICLSGEAIDESDAEKALGVWITSDLKWKCQTEKLINELNYGVSVLWRLRKMLGNKEMKMIAEGLIMSRIRYCLHVYGVEGLRINSEQSTSGLQQAVQKVQNNVLRIITGHTRSDHIRISDMFKATGMMSVNQMVAYGCLMETWKAAAFNVPILGSMFDRKRRDDRDLRSDAAGVVQSNVDESFANSAAKLWNLASEKFKSTNLLVIAKQEAKSLVRSLPI